MGTGMRIITRILRRHREVGGELGCFGLGSWWLSTFSAAQRQHMEAALQSPEMPVRARPLTRDRGLLPVQTAAGLLILLADKLGNQPQDRSLACCVLAKAEERALAGNDLLGLHSTYHQMIRIHLRWKGEFRDASDLAFAACHKQMQLSSQVAGIFRQRYPDRPLPVHLGYLHAASILEQQGGFSRAIEICRQAEAEGWSGDWSWRIQRMARRLHEQTPQMRPISHSGMGPV
jgi:hypothetical protein